MNRSAQNKRIFARSNQFVGREAEIGQLLSHARGESTANGLTVLSPPGAGSSELLRQVYDRLFTTQRSIIPFYFRISADDRDPQRLAARFLYEFVLQTVAFRRGDPRIIEGSPGAAELAKLASVRDLGWIERLTENYLEAGERPGIVRSCLSSPQIAASSGASVFVMIDQLHEASFIAGGDGFVDTVVRVFEHGSVAYVLSGNRRFLYERTRSPSLRIEQLPFADAAVLTDQLARGSKIALTEQTRDLIAVQLGSRPTLIWELLRSAAEERNELKTFADVEKHYTDQLFGGRVGKALDKVFDMALPDRGLQAEVIAILHETAASEDKMLPLGWWKKRLDMPGRRFNATIAALYGAEVINVAGGKVYVEQADIVLMDYLRARKSLDVDSVPRALALAELTAEHIHRAPSVMARHYRRTSAIGLKEIMSQFDGRQISSALLDYSRYKTEIKGAAHDRTLELLEKDDNRVSLPQFVFTAHSSAFYPRLNDLCDEERSAIGVAVSGEAGEDRLVWLAAEIDSKLEATRELAEFWCDRLEMVAASCNFQNYFIWLVAPEGFAPDAMEALYERRAIGSSRDQVRLLRRILENGYKAVDATPEQYEFTLPMGDDTEMIAAHTVEEIARRHNFSSKAVNQIKTALVEACINATEHSLSPDRKIRQTYSVTGDRITITVSNRGLRLADRIKDAPTDAGERRGWGLKLIKGLMDEVTFEQADDGTNLIMVKYLNKEENGLSRTAESS